MQGLRPPFAPSTHCLFASSDFFFYESRVGLCAFACALRSLNKYKDVLLSYSAIEHEKLTKRLLLKIILRFLEIGSSLHLICTPSGLVSKFRRHSELWGQSDYLVARPSRLFSLHMPALSFFRYILARIVERVSKL